jgi:hypothetical protein
MSSFQSVPYGIHPVSTYWVDIDFPIIVRTTGGNRPVMTDIQGGVEAPLWAVNSTLNIEGQEIIHPYKEGSPIQWHLHSITGGTDTTDRYVKFTIDWFWANSNTKLSDTITTTSPELLIPANTADRTMIPYEIEMKEMPDLKIGAHIWARLTRIAATGTAPTADLFVSMLQLHVECDTPGSTETFTK